MAEIRGQNNYTTMAVGEEGGNFTTQAVGEEGGNFTTQTVGEEGGNFTTQTVGEEGQDICPSCIEINNYTLILQLLITILKQQICNIGLGIGISPTL